MLTILLAAALLSDTTPRQDIALTRLSPPVERIDSGAPGAMLQNVAVTLECTARASGRVENCLVLGETHPGLGFGEAAIVLMRDAQVDPGRADVQFARTIQFIP